MMFDGRSVSPAGAAFAAAAQIDNLDGHDGYNPTKGHIGVVTIPALLTFAQVAPPIDAAEAITALVLGYEIGARAGIALHATVTDYHTSGAWNALAVAAMGARLMKLGPDKLREALGIAECHGPRSQMMRVIDSPTMLHDGSAWGALAGVTAVYLADQGFTGAPAATIEAEEVDAIWRDLGEQWVVHRHYIKPYPVCRWTHALIDSALMLRREHGLTGADIAAVERPASMRRPGSIARSRPPARCAIFRQLSRGRGLGTGPASASPRSRGRASPIPKPPGSWPRRPCMNSPSSTRASRPTVGARSPSC